MCLFCRAGNRTQALKHAKQVLHHQAHSNPLELFLIFPRVLRAGALIPIGFTLQSTLLRSEGAPITHCPKVLGVASSILGVVSLILGLH